MSDEIMTREEFNAHFGGEAMTVHKLTTYLCCISHDAGSVKTVYTCEGVTEHGEEKGDWKITIEQINGMEDGR